MRQTLREETIYNQLESIHYQFAELLQFEFDIPSVTIIIGEQQGHKYLRTYSHAPHCSISVKMDLFYFN